MDFSMKDLLQATIDEGGSDLHIRAYMPPKLRVHGSLEALSDEDLTEDESHQLCVETCELGGKPEAMDEVEKNGGADFAIAVEDGMLKVASGMTSLSEILRVTMGDAD